jgi:hypothetical protein
MAFSIDEHPNFARTSMNVEVGGPGNRSARQRPANDSAGPTQEEFLRPDRTNCAIGVAYRLE